MPRGVKGSGKAATVKKGAVTEKVPSAKKAKVADSAPAKKARKVYPSTDERIALADVQIERLTKTNDSRRALIEKTEAMLNARKVALAKSTASLEKVLGKK